MLGHKLHEVVASYIEGMRKHQERGPYNLGGWSAGGILAYAVAQELLNVGEQVSKLLLIDSPPPNRGLDRLPRRFFDHCTKVGLFGSEMSANGTTEGTTDAPKLPPWLMPHFEATIELLHDYHAPPMKTNVTMPKVTIIWAGECAFDGVKYPLLPTLEVEGEDTEGMRFLTEKRIDLGPGAWAYLFPGQDFVVEVMKGEHHFSMMREEGAENLAEMMREALNSG